MEGIVEEGGETIEEYEGTVLDAALIAAAQRVEHYEMAAYGSVCAYAELLNRTKDLVLLKETLEEEQQADEKLTELSETVNQGALESESEEEPAASAPPRGTTRARKSRSAA